MTVLEEGALVYAEAFSWDWEYVKAARFLYDKYNCSFILYLPEICLK